jgi:putative transcriptional regulator
MLARVKSLAPGFLIAMPQMGDPNFLRSVVLMIEHNEEGSMGLVLSRPASLTLAQLGKGQELPVAPSRLQEPVFVGGPVEPYRGFVLHDAVAIAEKVEVLPGLYLSVTGEALKPLLMMEQVRMRFCLGYSGWGPGQIDQELAQGAWLFTEATPEAALDGDPATLWGETLRGMGVDPAMLVVGTGVH